MDSFPGYRNLKTVPKLKRFLSAKMAKIRLVYGQLCSFSHLFNGVVNLKLISYNSLQMKIDKVEILTQNKKHATDVALLVDKPEFLKEINRLREKWYITELSSIESPIPNTTMGLDIEGIICSKFNDPDESASKWQEFNEDIEALLKKFNRGKNFKQVINYILIAGVVPDGIYRSCYFDVVAINESADMNKPERYQYAIILSPRTELKEVEEAFQEFKLYRTAKLQFESLPFIDGNDSDSRALIEQFHPGNIYISQQTLTNSEHKRS